MTVDWGTLGFDANAGPDYDAGSGRVTFDPGDTSETITVNVVGDPVVEADETFEVQLGNAVGATIADGSGTGTILNDDDYADVSILVTADHDATTRPVGAGQRLVYTLAVTNHGPGPAVNIRITDGLPHTSIPNDASFCEVVPPATTCDTTSGMPYGDATAIPMISALGAGGTRTYQVGYTVERGAPSGPMANTASITTYSSDATQANDSSTVSVRVDALPLASFTFNPSGPVVGETVAFDANGSTDDGSIAQYAWAFGDGGTGTGLSTTHVYTTARTYTVTLTVTDAVGGISSTTRSVVVSNPLPPPSAHRVLRGTVTRLVPFGPGGGPAGGQPLAGATVRVTTGSSFVEVATDAQGGYVFPNLVCPSNRCPVLVTEPGSSTVLASQTVNLGPDPSTTTLDLGVGTALDQLVLSGRVLAPASPPAVAPTIAIRVYRGSTNVWVADSAELFGGPGGYGPYQFALGRVGGGSPTFAVGAQLRVVLLENGVAVASTFVTIPARTGAAVPVAAADLTAIAPPPSAHRVLRGTVTRLVPFGPGGGPAGGQPLAGATVRVTTGSSFVEVATDAQGGYVFPNLVCPSNRCPVLVTEPGSSTVLASQTVNLGPDPSTTTLDLGVGTALDQLVLSGRVLAPASPPAVAPTIAIRVYRGSTNVWVADSAELFGGPGGYGPYQFALGRVGGGSPTFAVGAQLRVVLLENGVAVASTFVTIPARTGAAVPVAAADLTAIAPPPSAHRVLRGTVTRLVPFGPGGGPAGGQPLAGATVRVTTGSSFVEVATDAQGGYVFPNLVCPSNRCPVLVTEPGSSTVLASQTVNLGPDPSTTTLDLGVGTALDQLVLSGRVLAPASPPAVAPTIAIRVYRGSTNVWVADSAELFGGPGGYGPYQFALGRVGGGSPTYAVGAQLRVVLLENGVAVASTFVTIPARTGAAVPVAAADLQGR